MKAAAFVVALALAGCERPSELVGICQQSIAAADNPLRFRRLATETADSPATAEQLSRAAGLDANATGLPGAIARAQAGVWRDLAAGGPLALRRVAITYTDGDRPQAVRICGFAVAGGRTEPVDALKARARAAAAPGFARRTAEFDCCLAP